MIIVNNYLFFFTIFRKLIYNIIEKKRNFQGEH